MGIQLNPVEHTPRECKVACSNLAVPTINGRDFYTPLRKCGPDKSRNVLIVLPEKVIKYACLGQELNNVNSEKNWLFGLGEVFDEEK